MARKRNLLPVVTMYTDGSCDRFGNGGWSTLLYCGTVNQNLCGYFGNTTNNQMELYAVIAGLEKLNTKCEVELYSDSQYVVNGINSWLGTWARNGWKSNYGNKVISNLDLWQRMHLLKGAHQIKAHWVRGHDGNLFNEICDGLAQSCRTLYSPA